jgi:predicted lipid-binding transport protein (Tim44 family)
MGEGFEFIDIILFAMIAAFLIFRLRNVLGRRDGQEDGLPNPFRDHSAEDDGNSSPDHNVISLPEAKQSGEVSFADVPAPDEKTWPNSEVAVGVAQIRAADPGFIPKEFLDGASAAFEVILNAYVSGDRKALDSLLSPEVYGNFARAIDDRDEKKNVMEDTLVGIRAADIVEAYMNGETACLTVKFVTEQVNVTRDDQGHVIDGNPTQVTDVIDFWTFARDTYSANPNWALVATRSLD